MEREIVKVNGKTLIPTEEKICSKAWDLWKNNVSVKNNEEKIMPFLREALPDYFSENTHYYNGAGLLNFYQDLGNNVLLQLSIDNNLNSDKLDNNVLLKGKLLSLDSLSIDEEDGTVNINYAPALEKMDFPIPFTNVGDELYTKIGCDLLNLEEKSSSLNYRSANPSENVGFVAKIFNPTQERVKSAANAFREFNGYCGTRKEEIIDSAYLLMALEQVDMVAEHYCEMIKKEMLNSSYVLLGLSNSDFVKRPVHLNKTLKYASKQFHKKYDPIKKKFSKTGLEKYLI